MAKEIFQVQQSLVEVRFCKQDQMTICGDIHGQFLDFINIFDTFGYPSEHHYYLFNGDFVDRGPASIPCILTLLCFKIIYPHTFFMARGNHESCQINKLYGFEKDIKSKYADDENTFIFFQQLFDAIPLCHVIQDKIFVNFIIPVSSFLSLLYY